MINVKQRKERIFAEIDNPLEFIKNNLEYIDLHIKYSIDMSDVKIAEFLDDNSIMIVTDSDFVPNKNTLTIYGLLDKYIEILLDIEEVRGPGYFKCRIKSLKRAERIRRDVRFKVAPDEVVATNFKVSKHTIDISNFRIPTSIKVILDQFQSRNSNLADIVKLDILEPGDIIFEEIKKTGGTLFVEDVSKPESYKAISDDFIDLDKLLGEDLKEYIKKNVERGYRSIIISPVIYITEVESSIPFAYIQLVSKEDNFTLEKVLEVKGLVFNLIDRIRNANTLLLSVHQEIIDISKSGAKIKITDDNLKKYLIHSRGFVFDIVFKIQAPITIYGEIKCTYYDDEGNMYVGVDFEGNSSRVDEMKRFYSIVNPMVEKYKNSLIKERKRRSKALSN